MARLNGGKAQTSMSPQLLPGWGNKNILWRDFSVFEKMFSLLFDSKYCSVHCVFFNQHYCDQKEKAQPLFKECVFVCLLWALYFSFETVENGYECYPLAEH